MMADLLTNLCECHKCNLKAVKTNHCSHFYYSEQPLFLSTLCSLNHCFPPGSKEGSREVRRSPVISLNLKEHAQTQPHLNHPA